MQSRPITTLSQSVEPASASASIPLVEGHGASPGVASGRVRVLNSPQRRLAARERRGPRRADDQPRLGPDAPRAAAVVTDGGGMTCHAAIVSRELGVPCVVGTHEPPTASPRRGPRHGRRRAGHRDRGRGRPSCACRGPAWSGGARRRRPNPITATKLYVNLAMAEHAEEVAAMPVDGVGLLRAEFMLTDALEGRAPAPSAGDRRAGGVPRPDGRVAAARSRRRSRRGRSCTGRSTSASTSSAGSKAATQFEPEERNPMIGYRGCYRYVREPDLFALELELLARVREETPNLHLMIPFVRTRWELEACLELVDASPLGATAGLLAVGHGRGAVGRVPAPRVRRAGHRRRLDRVERPHPARCSASTATPRSARELFDESDAAVLDAIGRIIRTQRRARPHVVAVRAGAVEPPGVRRAPRAVRHRLGLGEPRCR